MVRKAYLRGAAKQYSTSQEGKSMKNHRSFRGRTTVAAAGSLVLMAAVLAGCSSSDSDSAAEDTAAEDTAAEDTAADEGEAEEEAAPEDACNLLTLLGVDAADPLNGQTLKLGAVLPLSGGGEKAYGESMTKGIDLALEDIAASGGPNIELDVKDNGTANPELSVTAINELGEAGTPAILSSLVNSFAAMNDGLVEYDILALDGGGGTATWNKGAPYFYGTRAVSPDDTLVGMAEYLKGAYPDKKSYAVVTWQLDPELNEMDKAALTSTLEASGMEFSGVEYVPFGGTDYASAIAKVKEANPDYVLVSIYGADPGIFASQAKAAGLESQMVGFEFTQGGLDASRGAWDEGWLFVQDYFNHESPDSDLGACFAANFQAKYGENPDFYAANYYEGLLGLWELAREVQANGGDYNSGADMLAALEADPTLVSVYGGDGATAGNYTLDAESHSVSERPIGVFEYKSGSVTPLASFGPGGSNYQALN